MNMPENCATCGENPLDETDECVTLDMWNEERLAFCDLDCLRLWIADHEADGKLHQ
jgi:hypothetical protein